MTSRRPSNVLRKHTYCLKKYIGISKKKKFSPPTEISDLPDLSKNLVGIKKKKCTMYITHFNEILLLLALTTRTYS